MRNLLFMLAMVHFPIVAVCDEILIKVSGGYRDSEILFEHENKVLKKGIFKMYGHGMDTLKIGMRYSKPLFSSAFNRINVLNLYGIKSQQELQADGSIELPRHRSKTVEIIFKDRNGVRSIVYQNPGMRYRIEDQLVERATEIMKEFEPGPPVTGRPLLKPKR